MLLASLILCHNLELCVSDLDPESCAAEAKPRKPYNSVETQQSSSGVRG